MSSPTIDAAFVQAVAENRQELLRCDFVSGMRTLEVTLAANESARTGKPVECVSWKA
jgi:hypothetical protein